MQPIDAKLFAGKDRNLILKIKLQIEVIPINAKQRRARLLEEYGHEIKKLRVKGLDELRDVLRIIEKNLRPAKPADFIQLLKKNCHKIKPQRKRHPILRKSR